MNEHPDLNLEPVDAQRVAQAIDKQPQQALLDRLSEFFKVMGDPTRLKVLIALEEGELCASDLALVAGMSRSAVSHQLKSLRAAKLVKTRKEGKAVYYSLDDSHIHSVLNVSFEHILEDD